MTGNRNRFSNSGFRICSILPERHGQPGNHNHATAFGFRPRHLGWRLPTATLRLTSNPNASASFHQNFPEFPLQESPIGSPKSLTARKSAAAAVADVIAMKLPLVIGMALSRITSCHAREAGPQSGEQRIVRSPVRMSCVATEFIVVPRSADELRQTTTAG
jgi:hypothetical protein